MVRRSLVLGTFVLLGLSLVRSTLAAPINFTGNVANDFPTAATGNGILTTNALAVQHATLPDWMKAIPGRNTGMDFNSVSLSYDQKTDVLSVGIKFNGVGGDLDGNGTVGTVDSPGTPLGMTEPKNFGGQQIVALGISVNKSGNPDIAVGIPLNKPTNPATGKPMDGVSAFTLAAYNNNQMGLVNGFGSTTVGGVNLLDHLGAKSIATSSSSPDMEFQIKDFTQVAKLFNPNFDPTKDSLTLIGYSADLGSVVGKSVLDQKFTTPLAETITPEPATLLAWSAVLGLAVAYRVRRHARCADVRA